MNMHTDANTYQRTAPSRRGLSLRGEPQGPAVQHLRVPRGARVDLLRAILKADVVGLLRHRHPAHRAQRGARGGGRRGGRGTALPHKQLRRQKAVVGVDPAVVGFHGAGVEALAPNEVHRVLHHGVHPAERALCRRAEVGEVRGNVIGGCVVHHHAEERTKRAPPKRMPPMSVLANLSVREENAFPKKKTQKKKGKQKKKRSPKRSLQ